MNYIKQINAFWEVERERGNFTAPLQSFYFALLYFANKFGKEEFSVYREDITDQSKLSNNTYYQVRSAAKEAGLIDFKEGLNKRSKCTFSVLLLYQNKDTTGTDTKTPTEQEEDADCDHTHKLTKVTKLTNSKTSKPQKKKVAASKDDAPQESQGSDSSKGKKKKEVKEEKGSAQKEEKGDPVEESRRAYHQLYKEAWWDFYKSQNNGEEPPKSKRHPGTWNGLKKIQQDLAAVFGDCELSGYQEFVYILESWPKLKDYHRLQLMPPSIHKNLIEIRMYLRGTGEKVAAVPLVSEAIDLYKRVFHQQRGFAPSINGKAQEQAGQTLTYLKDFKEGNTWEQALKGFELILQSWPELEKQDDFYKNNFTLSYINGNTSSIISIIKSRGEKRAELTVDSAQAWLEKNRLSA